MFKKLLPFFLLLFLSFWAVFPLFHSGFFPMHDDEQIARLFELNQTLSAGQFPPRWIDGLGFGFGYPFFNFYPPFVYYFGEIFHLLGISLIDSTKIVMGLGFLLSGLFSYLLAKEFFGKSGGLVTAVFYLYAPYHSLDLYVRGALAEFYAFVFLPAVLWSTFKLIKERNRNWLVINSCFLSLLLLSHNLIALIFLPFYFAFAGFLVLPKKDKKKIILSFLCSFMLFLGLSAYFWLPALLERQYTLVDQILTGELASYKLHFVYLRQFISSPWGYGGSIYGLNDGISFEVGKLHLLLSFLGGVFGLYLFLKKRKEWQVFMFYVLCFMFSLFMASFYSQFIWDKLQPLWYVQFPWRFLVFTALFSSLLAGGLASYVSKIRQPFTKWLMLAFLIAFVVLLNRDYFRPARYLEVTDKDYTTKEELNWRVSKMSFEYVPKGIATVLSDIQTTQVDIKREEIPINSFVSDGRLQVKEKQILPHEKKYEVFGEGGKLTVNTYNFPGWEVKIDGQKTKIDDNNKFKLITVAVPKGSHLVEVVFNDTPLRTLGNFASVISFFSLIMLLFLPKHEKRS
ncbi:MAG: 6-pyruvoyl-tetrahydropterin synthase-related protein [Patescibacteria group bacterium]|nr:6-pyruvoyl-tetrahydropterin synthase-related protein [Patescibacteria group bacterium]MCL5095194.1 6-pyruvoyl-tetrahydropterin synthase-related protein [Patescibacteria group bacterium]